MGGIWYSPWPLSENEKRGRNSVVGARRDRAVRFRLGREGEKAPWGKEWGARPSGRERGGKDGRGGERRSAEPRGGRGGKGERGRGVDGAPKLPLRGARSGNASRPPRWTADDLCRALGWSRDPSGNPASGVSSRRGSGLRATLDWRWQARWSL